MELELKRYSDNGDSTLGLLFIDGQFFCHVLEDEHRDKKVMHETRIPEGTYKVGIQRQLTGMTKKYLAKHSFFKRHIHIKDVPNFTGIYIHIGNYDEDTSGCLLLGDGVNNNQIKKGKVHPSTAAYRRFYKKVYKYAERGEITIHVTTI